MSRLYLRVDIAVHFICTPERKLVWSSLVWCAGIFYQEIRVVGGLNISMEKRDQPAVTILPLLALAVLSFLPADVKAATSLPTPVKLQWHYYKVHNTCDDAEAYIQYQVKRFWQSDKSITPKLLRLLYSDCLVTVSLFLLFYFWYETSFAFLIFLINHGWI